MKKLNFQGIERLLIRPEAFQDLENLKENIVAYGELEYILGFYQGTFNIFKELCDEVNDLKVALEVRDAMVEFVEQNTEKKIKSSVDVNLSAMIIALIHNSHKKNNRYKIND